jgi:hypothetical protein
MTSLIKLPKHPVKTATASESTESTESTELAFSSGEMPSSKFTLNINAFNGNNTNFGGNRNSNK